MGSGIFQSTSMLAWERSNKGMRVGLVSDGLIQMMVSLECLMASRVCDISE